MIALGLALAAGCSNSSHSGFVIPPPTEFGEGGLFGDGGEAGIGPGCASVSLGAKRQPLDLFLLQDISGSMAGIPWAMCKASLESFFTNPPSPDISAALTFFPIPKVDTCSRTDYSFPAVGMGPLPAQAAALTAALERTTPIGGTPTQAALDGTLFAAVAYKAAHPDHQVAAVLVSDGLPNYCGQDKLYTLPKIALAEHGVLTFAIGTTPDAVLTMDQIAAAGGTGKSLSVTDASHISESLRQAQLRAVGCQLVFPKTTAAGLMTDPALVNVDVTDDLGKRTIPRVGALASCGNKEGWYYDDPKSPTLILLCPASCTVVQANRSSQLDATVGCNTVVR